MRIALFLPNWVGDVVMATPAIRAVRQTFPKSHLVAVCRSYVADTVAGSPWFDRVIHSEKGQTLRAVRELRKERIDKAVLFPNSFRSALLAKLGGAVRLIGFARHGRSWMLDQKLHPKRDRSGKPQPTPIINDYNRLVSALGADEPGTRMELFTTSADEGSADRLWRIHDLSGREVIGLNPGGAFGSAKFWPVEHFADLARSLTNRRNTKVLVLCGPNEREQARKIRELSQSELVVSLADEELSLGLTKACIKRMTALITTDSGPRHFAAAFDRPVVTLFGPTHIEWTETYFPKAVHLQKDVPCGPCQLRTCPLDHRCMRDLSPEEVIDAVDKLLSRPAGLEVAA